MPLPRSHAQTTDSLYLLALQRVGNKFSQADLALQYHELVGTGRDCVSVPFFIGAYLSINNAVSTFHVDLVDTH